MWAANRIGRGTALTPVWNGALASFRGVRMSADILTQALYRNLQAASGVSNGSEIADYGRTEITNPVPVILSFLIGTTKARQARRTENPTMWALLRKSRTVLFILWRAIPAIAAVKITMPWGIMRYWGMVYYYIKIKRIAENLRLFFHLILFEIIQKKADEHNAH